MIIVNACVDGILMLVLQHAAINDVGSVVVVAVVVLKCVRLH
jgi:hypothetical protein